MQPEKISHSHEREDSIETAPLSSTTEHSPTPQETMPLAPNYEEARKKIQISPEDYCDIYSPEKIAKDKVALEIKKNEDENKGEAEDRERSLEAKKFATLLENLTVELSNFPPWIPNARFMKASEFDDRCRGTDIIIEIHQAKTGRPITIALDVTLGKDEIKKKMDETIITPNSRIFNKPSPEYYPAKKYDHEHPAERPTAIVKLALGTTRDVVIATMAQKRAVAILGEKATKQELTDARIRMKNINGIKKAILLGGFAQSEIFRDHAKKIGDTASERIYDLVAKYFKLGIENHTKMFGNFPEEHDEVLEKVYTTLPLVI